MVGRDDVGAEQDSPGDRCRNQWRGHRRELLLNGVAVCLIDRWDIAGGTTAYSSRLIHGGLRYLEYGDFALVRESLTERERLLQLAPQFVRPLELFIPVEQRASGFLAAARKFFGWPPPAGATPVPRGMWLVRMGLFLYDRSPAGPHCPATVHTGWEQRAFPP